MNGMTVAQIQQQLEAAGVPREKAEWQARHECGLDPVAAPSRSPDVLEKDEQHAITKMARALGFTVYNLSQARKSKQTPGLPDLWMMRSMFGMWWETKRQVGGELSPAQVAFREQCVAANVHHGAGDRFAFAAFLTQHGFTPPLTPTNP